MKFSTLACGCLFVAGMVKAEVYAWRDHEGVVHFTNVQADIPMAYRDAAQVVVSAAWAPKEETLAAPDCAEAAPRKAETLVVPGRPPTREVGATAEVPTREVVVEGSRVHIEGPLAVTSVPQVAAWPPWFVGPLVTTSFDRGRSRHLTLRQLAEAQWWLAGELGWAPMVPVFAGGPRPPCVAFGTCIAVK